MLLAKEALGDLLNDFNGNCWLDTLILEMEIRSLWWIEQNIKKHMEKNSNQIGLLHVTLREVTETIKRHASGPLRKMVEQELFHRPSATLVDPVFFSKTRCPALQTRIQRTSCW